MAICGQNIQTATFIEQFTDFIYLVNMIYEFKTDITTKLRRYNKINGKTKIHFGKNMLQSTKL
jgi:hypothetical protein